MSVLFTLLPDFAIIALGAAIGRHISASSWRQLDSISYYVLYPALLFGAASSREIDASDLAILGLLACAVVTLGFLLALLANRRVGGEQPTTDAGRLQNAWRFNTALGFVAVAALPASAAASLAIIVGLAIPLANLYAILSLTRGQSRSIRSMLGEIALNPFLLASLAGVAVGLAGNPLPEVVNRLVARLADAAIPIVLLSLGAALRQSALWPPDRLAYPIHAIKLLVLPAAVCLLALLGGFRGVPVATLLIFAALPTASAAHVLATRFGADRGEVALVVMQSTLLGLLSLPVWTAIAVYLLGG